MMANQLGVTLGKVSYVEELLSYADGDFSVPPRDRGISAHSAGSVQIVGSSQTISFFGQRFSARSGVKAIFDIVNTK
jgi:hypothetical protein